MPRPALRLAVGVVQGEAWDEDLLPLPCGSQLRHLAKQSAETTPRAKIFSEYSVSSDSRLLLPKLSCLGESWAVLPGVFL